MIIQRPGYGQSCMGCFGARRRFGAPVTEVTFDTPEIITASAPKTTGTWSAGAEQKAGSSGVASDAEIAAARKKSAMKWAGIGLAALVGLAVVTRR